MNKSPILLTSLRLMIAIFLFALPLEAAKAPKAPASTPLEIQLGAPFCDNAILQRGMEVPVWGWSVPGTVVTVNFAEKSAKATAGANGKWIAKLARLDASFVPREMVITESTGKSATLKNILVGEVWMASGQSNMQWTSSKSTCRKLSEDFKKRCDADGLKINPIREFRVNSVTSQLHPIEKATGSWRDGDYVNYSAIAFAFAEKLYREVKVPIAILNCSFSQTPIEAWVPREGWATAKDEHSKAINLQCLQTDPTTPEHREAWSAFYKSLEDQISVSQVAIEKGEDPKIISEKLPGNLYSNRDANWLYNGMLNPVVPYAIRGAIWNQGYANMGKGISYYNNLHSLIRGWRIVWNQPELPVYFHQFYTPSKVVPPPSIGSTEEMRLGTAMARDIPNTGMASQIDISGGIHYSNKAVPGQRLALHALKHQYGKDIVTDGPFFKAYKVERNKVIVEFDHAEGGLVVADTAFNRSRNEKATGFADPRVIENGEDKVEFFYLAGEDRVWHPATFKIEGEKVVVTSEAVKQPRGVSYASGGVAFNPCLYNKAMLPMTPFIYYDQKMVTQKTYPDEKLKLAGETIDPNEVGKLYDYRKMPLLSVQFRDNAVFQAEQPVTIWGSTRKHGEWQDEPNEGDCKVHFQFGDIRKVIDVTPDMVEWKVTLPPMKASAKVHTLKVHFTIDGETVHERIVPGIVFGDVWCVIAPALGRDERKRKVNWMLPEVKPSGQIVRMIENQSNRDGRSSASRYSICTSRTPKNRLAARWKEADDLVAAMGHRLASKAGRPVGIIFLEAKRDIPLKNWVAPDFLKDTPDWLDDYRTVGSQYPNNPFYLENVRRYISEWKHFWGNHVLKMMETKAVPDGSSWGSYPSPNADIGDSTASFEYNVYLHSFTPAALKGIVFLTGKGMVEDDGVNFGRKMSVLAKSFKTRLGLEPKPGSGWKTGNIDIPFYFTLPSREMAPKIQAPEIKGLSVAVEINDWTDGTKIIDALVK
jgi:hypothetical protein